MNKQMMSALILSVSLVSGMAFAQAPEVKTPAKEEVQTAKEKLATDKKEGAAPAQIKADKKALKKAHADRKKEKGAKKEVEKSKEIQNQQDVQEPAAAHK